MTRVFELLFSSMVDARVRRILEEAFLDWAHEAQSVTTAPARLICHARGMASFLEHWRV